MTLLPHSVRTVFTISAFALLLGPLHLSADSIPVTYQFTGVCVDCPPSDIGIGMLTLQNYTLGAQILSSNFVNFTYSSDVIPLFQAPSTDQVSISGVLPVSLPGMAFIDIQDTTAGVIFLSTTLETGLWCVGTDCAQDEGSASSWDVADAVPEPGSLILLGIGIFSLAVWRRLRNGTH